MSPKAKTEYAAAKGHVTYAEKSVAKQREIIESLDANSQPTDGARRTLENLEQSLELLRRYLRTFGKGEGARSSREP